MGVLRVIGSIALDSWTDVILGFNFKTQNRDLSFFRGPSWLGEVFHGAGTPCAGRPTAIRVFGRGEPPEPSALPSLHLAHSRKPEHQNRSHAPESASPVSTIVEAGSTALLEAITTTSTTSPTSPDTPIPSSDLQRSVAGEYARLRPSPPGVITIQSRPVYADFPRCPSPRLTRKNFPHTRVRKISEGTSLCRSEALPDPFCPILQSCQRRPRRTPNSSFKNGHPYVLCHRSAGGSLCNRSANWYSSFNRLICKFRSGDSREETTPFLLANFKSDVPPPNSSTIVHNHESHSDDYRSGFW